MNDVDVVVVGARCAGAPLSALLAQHGLSVRLFDRARFPSDTASTHIVQPRGAQVLDRLGVLTGLHADGAAQTRRLLLAYDDARVDADYTTPQARAALSSGATLGVSVRRTILDETLVHDAAEVGVDVRSRTGITGLLRDRSGRVCGVRTDTEAVTAALVVGADGRSSTVATEVGAAEYATYDAPRFAVWGYFEGAGDDHGTLRIGRFGRDAFVANPTDNGLYLAAVVPDMSERDTFLADRETRYASALARWPELRDLIGDARRVGPLRVVPDWHGYFREAAGPGWVLVGDAGHFKDPAAAQGITDALRQAERLTDHVVRGLSTGTLDAELAAFWRWRDDDCSAMHWFAADMGAAGPTRPVTTEAVRDVGDSDEASTGLLQVLNRDLAPTDLLNMARLARSARAALRRRPSGAVAVGAEIVASGRAEARHRIIHAAARRRIRRQTSGV